MIQVYRSRDMIEVDTFRAMIREMIQVNTGWSSDRDRFQPRTHPIRFDENYSSGQFLS